ncbi:Pycsar system effector family protein [Salinicola avicenniae]|uniref:Pycsar system effector family protein n=1 Tax=Salinicola avicenniae TaxID=2916836 RepID=UPI0020736609|nr:MULTISPECIES: Pycsar system effector family protein [unclassified Salinicola]
MKQTTEGLLAIFDIVNNWLKFAEQKTGVIIVLNSGLSWGVTRLSQSLIEKTGFAALTSITIISMSTTLCIISLLPIMQKMLCGRPSIQTEEKRKSCIYFGDIAGMTNTEFSNAYAKSNGIETDELNGFDKDIIDQIITNSKIALEKFFLVRIASWLTFIGLIIFPLGMLLSLT